MTSYETEYVLRYGEYMREHGFRWAIVVLVEPHCRPTRQAEKVCVCACNLRGGPCNHSLEINFVGVYAGM